MLDSLFSRKEKIFIVIVILIFVSGATIRVLKSKHIIGTHSEVVEFDISKKEEKKESALFYVQVEGFVVNPGIYEIPAGGRISDAIKSAGGALPNGEPEALNLVLPVVDGMRIYVPKNGAVIDDPNKYINIGPTVGSMSDISDEYAQVDINSKVDINSATCEELARLPGVGEVLAGEIIKYRKSIGKFEEIDDLKNVKGIGEVKFSKIKDYIICK